MANYIELAKAYSSRGYSCIPVTSEKVPAIRNWGIWQTRRMSDSECEQHFKNCFGIALLCGGMQKITCLDFDLKYDLSGDIFERFKQKLPVELLKKMYVQKTMNNGYHFIFSCSKVEPNQKLASRYTTEYEQHQTYMEAFNEPKSRSKALKIALNDRSRVIFETRGGSDTISGGYCLMSPSPGYKHVHGKIQEISVEEYDLLLETARSFNDVIEERNDIRFEKYKDWELSPFADFNERFDFISYLEDNGWEVVGGKGSKTVRVKRAGNPSSGSSALFDTETRKFNCFSTSASIDVGRAYSPADLFILWDCENDMSLAFRKLIELGFGKEK